MTKDTPSLADELLPRLGQKVRIADHCPDSEQWNQGDNYVVGLTTEIGKPGVNVWIASEYPMTSEGPTDGYWINRWPKPNDLEWNTRPTEARTGGDALREAAGAFAFEQRADDKPDGWNAACDHIANAFRYEANPFGRNVEALSHPTPADARTPDDVVERLRSEDLNPGTLVHKLIRYAEINEDKETRTHGRPATNSWAAAFREAAAALTASGDARAIADIAAERRRQIDAEGWTPEHDDSHRDGDIAAAAGCYALNASRPWGSERDLPMNAWPWDSRWWKPGGATTEGKRRDLVKAGALIAAEIERLDRLALLDTPPAGDRV